MQIGACLCVLFLGDIKMIKHVSGFVWVSLRVGLPFTRRAKRKGVSYVL